MLTDPEADYARGFVPFLDCRIYLDSHPLIPRVETEFWVEKAIQELQLKGAPKCLDLFAGSGAIGVAVLKHVPSSRVDFGEIGANHLPTILKNILENGIDPNRASVIKTDVWSAMRGVYDFILANPPYLAKERVERLQDSVVRHEPHMALFAEDGGFALIEKTILGAPEHLSPAGVLYIEHEPEQARRISEIAEKTGLTAETKYDQYGIARYSLLSRMA